MPAPQAIIDDVTSKVSPNTYPKLTADEIVAEIEKTSVLKAWQPSTFYPIGTVVIPSVRTGVAWRAEQEGTSWTQEPDWLLIWDRNYPWLFQDNTVYWRAWQGDTMPSLYNPRRAIYELWMIKAGRATGDFNYSQGDAGSASPATIAQNCRDQAAKYKSFSIH